MNIKKILFPTDFSPCSEAALATALFHAQTYAAELHILHVVVPGSDDMVEAFPEPDLISEKLHQVASVRMQETLEKHREEPFRVVEAMRAGTSPAPLIKRYEEEHDIDLIVMGTHGRTGFKHFLMGSVAENVVRTAKCPVVTVRADENQAPLKRIDHILVPLDFSEFSEAVLLTGMDLAQKHDAQLHLLHIIEDYFHPGTVESAWTGMGDPVGKYREIREKQLADFAVKASEAGVPTHTCIISGRAPAGIVQHAKSAKADLIVMGTHGYSGIEHMWLGSTAERVVRISDVPVFTIKVKG